MRTRLLVLFSVFVGLESGLGQASENADRNDLARKALQEIVGQDLDGRTPGPCSTCHHQPITQDTILRWSERERAIARDDCRLDEETIPAQERLGCLRDSMRFNGGLLRAALGTERIKGLFKNACGDSWEKAYGASWVKRATMPPAPRSPMNDASFDRIRDWLQAFDDGSSREFRESISKNLVNGGPWGPARVATCQDQTSPALAAHIDYMQKYGWPRKLRNQRDFQLFACPQKSADPSACFQQEDTSGPVFPLKPEWAASQSELGVIDGVHIRVLKDMGKAFTDYWMRVSPDGRFIGVGGIGFVDLEHRLTGVGPETIAINADYDPGFFSDNQGFVFQGEKTILCRMSLLHDPQIRAKGKIEIAFDAVDEPGRPRPDVCAGDAPPLAFENLATPPTRVPTPEELYCSLSNTNLYQSVGSSLGGDAHFILDGFDWTSDPGDHLWDPPVDSFAYGENEISVKLFTVNDDTGLYERAPHSRKANAPAPFEGDFFMAPSSQLLISRGATRDEPYVQDGYVLRSLKVDIAQNQEGKKQIAAVNSDIIGKACMRGAKPVISFDERFLVTHHYVDYHDYREYGFASVNDPAFQELLESSSDLMITDLLTGRKARITNMGVGRRALFPHFRADGWLYFMVQERGKKAGEKHVYFAASDAALRLAASGMN